MRRLTQLLAAALLALGLPLVNAHPAAPATTATPAAPSTITATASPVGPSLNAIGTHYMQGNPSAAVPAGLAAQGFHELNKGDALPAGVVWADPNVIFAGANSPQIAPDPTAASSSGPTNAVDWAPTACFNTSNIQDNISTGFIWAVGSESNIRTENPWGFCYGGGAQTALASSGIIASSGFGTADAQSGPSWGIFALPYWQWKALNVGSEGFYNLILNAGDTYNYWVQTVDAGAYGCPPSPNYQRCTQIGFGFVPMLATATLDLLNGAWGNFRSVNQSSTTSAESSLEGGVSNPVIFGGPQVQNPASRQFVGLDPSAWSVFMNHPYTDQVNALASLAVWEVWQN